MPPTLLQIGNQIQKNGSQMKTNTETCQDLCCPPEWVCNFGLCSSVVFQSLEYEVRDLPEGGVISSFGEPDLVRYYDTDSRLFVGYYNRALLTTVTRYTSDGTPIRVECRVTIFEGTTTGTTTSTRPNTTQGSCLGECGELRVEETKVPYYINPAGGSGLWPATRLYVTNVGFNVLGNHQGEEPCPIAGNMRYFDIPDTFTEPSTGTCTSTAAIVNYPDCTLIEQDQTFTTTGDCFGDNFRSLRRRFKIEFFEADAPQAAPGNSQRADCPDTTDGIQTVPEGCVGYEPSFLVSLGGVSETPGWGSGSGSMDGFWTDLENVVGDPNQSYASYWVFGGEDFTTDIVRLRFSNPDVISDPFNEVTGIEFTFHVNTTDADLLRVDTIRVKSNYQGFGAGLKTSPESRGDNLVLPGGDFQFTVGGPTDLWGWTTATGPTLTDYATTLGVWPQFAATRFVDLTENEYLRIDAVECKIYYETP